MKNYNFSEIDCIFKFNNYENLKDFNLPEFCFTGRSNVGKSSIINSLLNKKRIATTSTKPGHTKKIFFYKITNSFVITDLPGYGFANMSKKKKEEISELLFFYLTKRKELKRIFVLVDSRRGLKSSDKSFIELLQKYNLSHQIVFTKFDKVPPNNEKNLLKNIENSNVNMQEKVIFSSSKTKIGIKEIRKEIISTVNNDH